jgi:hypothetical protein
MTKRRFTLRQEANAITAGAFRNGLLEDLHAGKHSALLDDHSLSRITDDEMRRLMIQASTAVARLLARKAEDPDRYWQDIEFFSRYCQSWDQSEVDADTPVPVETR